MWPPGNPGETASPILAYGRLPAGQPGGRLSSITGHHDTSDRSTTMAANTRWMAAVVACGFMAAAAPAAAQSTTPVALENLATAVLQDRNDLVRAAKLYREAANDRAIPDDQAVQDLRAAGMLFATAGKLGAAQSAMEKAGERALGAGMLGDAADAFANAALVAAMTHSPNAAQLAHRANWWAAQDGVSETMRASIHARLDPTVAALAAR